MKVTVQTTKEAKTLHIEAGVRYWEDATVNGVEDEEGDLIPCRKGDYWKPVIDIDTGKILNWKDGTRAVIHYKVCDDGIYTIKDAEGNILLKHEGYVRNIACPNGEGYGDYIIMTVNEEGIIDRWNNQDLSDFYEDEN